MKEVYDINILDLKREIFDLFNNARVLFNDFYNGKQDYNDEDIKNIYNLILKAQDNINNIESMID